MTEIELTDAQRQALRAEQGKPVDVVDPATQQRYVLLAREQYERVRTLLEQAAGPEPRTAAAVIPPAMLRSQQAFWRDLPGLLRDKRNRGKWAAYHGAERVGLGKTSMELYQRCLQRGLRRGEFYVGRIKEEETPPWGTLESDWSLYECTEGRNEEDVPPGAL